MPLIIDRQQVLDTYAEAASRRWVLPAFNTENPTCTEAILAGALEYSRKHGLPNLPVITGLTNTYWHRAQTANYVHCRNWKIGMRMFMDDLRALTDKGSPYADLRVMIHMDHIQWDADAELLADDLGSFSSIMFDASKLPFDENIRLTAAFTEKHRKHLFIEGACDEIKEATDTGSSTLTTPEMAQRYCAETGVDIIVANLGTEHRATSANLRYHGEVAREIKKRIGTRICLHGTSSVPHDQLRSLFDDGIIKVNIWTALERDSSPVLLQEMVQHAGKVAGGANAATLAAAGLLGERADLVGPAALSHYTTMFRQDLVFREMKRIVGLFLELWYTGL